METPTLNHAEHAARKVLIERLVDDDSGITSSVIQQWARGSFKDAPTEAKTPAYAAAVYTYLAEHLDEVKYASVFAGLVDARHTFDVELTKRLGRIMRSARLYYAKTAKNQSDIGSAHWIINDSGFKEVIPTRQTTSA